MMRGRGDNERKGVQSRDLAGLSSSRGLSLSVRNRDEHRTTVKPTSASSVNSRNQERSADRVIFRGRWARWWDARSRPCSAVLTLLPAVSAWYGGTVVSRRYSGSGRQRAHRSSTARNELAPRIRHRFSTWLCDVVCGAGRYLGTFKTNSGALVISYVCRHLWIRVVFELCCEVSAVVS